MVFNLKLMRLLLVIPFFLFKTVNTFSQQIYSCDYPEDAGVKVFVTQYKNEADLVVYRALYERDGKGNNGVWYFCEYSADANLNVYFTDYIKEADVIIFYTDIKSDAGWRKFEKKEKLKIG